jgi:four helix bundle protein
VAWKKEDSMPGGIDRLESFIIYQIARGLFNDFWVDSEILDKDYRGKELVRQQVRSLDSICANIEEGYGRGFGRELPQHLKIARGEARESKGRYERCGFLLPNEVIEQRTAVLDQIIGGLTNTIKTIEAKRDRSTTDQEPVTKGSAKATSRHTSRDTRHTSRDTRHTSRDTRHSEE